jgi:putative flavoprotein involved in K+ transport
VATSIRSSYDVVIVGAGQAGLALGYHLARKGLRFIILDANPRIGDQWRNQWESLRLFTPARYDGLPGMRFPAPAFHYPLKDEMADYLESYAERFQLPVRNGTRVDRLTNNGDRFVVQAGIHTIEAENVIVAMGDHQYPRVPAFAEDLDPSIVQLHSSEYRNPSQLQDGDVLIVGAGNSGAEIAMDVVGTHRTWVAGRNTGQIPFDITGFAARLILVRLVLRGLFHRVLTIDTPIGRTIRPKILSMGGPLIRTKRKHMAKAGIEFLPRVAGVQSGLLLLDDGRTLEVANVVWCTGYHPGFEAWIDLPVHGDREPLHEGGIVPSQPGLYFVGLLFLYALSSEMIQGVSRDAERIAKSIEARRASSGKAVERVTNVAA